MEWLLISLIVFLLVIMISILIFGWLIVKKNRLEINIINPDKSITIKKVSGKIGTTIIVNDCEYFIDDKTFIKTFWNFKTFYFYGNPNPIIFDFDMNRQQVVGTKAQDIKSFHESDLIKKLFQTENLENYILYLCIGIALLCAIIIIILLSKKTGMVTLENNLNNTQLIVDAVKIAMNNPIPR